MFNNEKKEGFIQDYMRSRVVAKTSLYSLFKKTEFFEEQYDKDCSKFTQEEILNMYKDFHAKSVYVLLNYNTILKAYYEWFRYYHDASLEINYGNITIDMIKPCVPVNKNKFISREEMTEIEDQLYNWTDKAIIECLWEGISGPSMIDVVCIKNDMIDHKTKELYLPDKRIIQLTDKLYELLIKAFDEEEYLCYGKTLKVKKLSGKGSLYKERDNAHAVDSGDKYFRWVYRKIQNFREHVGIPDLTMKNINISGMYYYLCIDLKETGLNLRQFLQTEQGRALANRYGFHSEFRVDNLIHRFKEFI